MASNCLNRPECESIVQSAIQGNPFPLSNTLEQCGLINSNQRLDFRERVFNEVLAKGCRIHKNKIFYGKDKTIEEVRDSVKDNLL